MLSANTFFLLPQQIDEMLAGALTQEDEDAVLAELEAITQVGVEPVVTTGFNCFPLSASTGTVLWLSCDSELSQVGISHQQHMLVF